MKKEFVRRKLFDAFMLRNWEANIQNVVVEPCATQEDPLGFRAVFVPKWETQDRAGFTIGASLLPQREINLARAGYKAPMTQRAITLIEDKLSHALPLT